MQTEETFTSEISNDVKNQKNILKKMLKTIFKSEFVEWRSESISNLFQKFLEQILLIERYLQEPFDFATITTIYNNELLNFMANNQIQKPLHIYYLPKSFDLISKLLVQKKITPDWIKIDFWKSYYVEIDPIKSQKKLAFAVRKMILLVNLLAKQKND